MPGTRLNKIVAILSYTNLRSALFSCVLAISMISLTALPAKAAEKAFVVTTEEWPPFVGAELDGNGWAMEVARAALESQGYKVSLDLLPWARSVHCAKSGRCDGLYLSYYVKEREEWFVFSDPIGELRTGFFKLEDRDIAFETLRDLRPYRIGMTRGAAVSEAFDTADYLKKDPVPHHTTNIKKLLRGRLDLVVAAKPVFEYLIRTNLPESEQDKFEFLPPSLSTQSLHMAVSKQSPHYEQKLEDFNRGLAQIRADGTYDAIRRAHGY